MSPAAVITVNSMQRVLIYTMLKIMQCFFFFYVVCNAKGYIWYQMQKKSMNKQLNNALFNKQIQKKVVCKLFKSNTMDWCIY